MSEETARAVAAAEADESQQRALVDRLKQETLDSVAEYMPDHIDAYAKELAQKQPAATKALGPAGVSTLRKELAEAAQNLGAELKQSAAKIAWAANYEGVSYALAQFLGGSNLAPFNHTLRKHGYTIDTHESVSAYDLFTSPQDQFFELEEQVRKLSQKTGAVQAAKKADDQDTVESIWDDSSR